MGLIRRQNPSELVVKHLAKLKRITIWPCEVKWDKVAFGCWFGFLESLLIYPLVGRWSVLCTRGQLCLWHRLHLIALIKTWIEPRFGCSVLFSGYYFWCNVIPDSVYCTQVSSSSVTHSWLFSTAHKTQTPQLSCCPLFSFFFDFQFKIAL